MLYYIHGYLSGPNSRKGILLKKELNVKPIKYRDCEPEELVVKDAVENIIKQIKKDDDVILIGSSLGGFLSAKVALKKPDIKKLILLNPAIIPPYQDLDEIDDMPRRILKEMQDEKLYKTKLKPEIIILRGTKDEVVPTHWVMEFAKAQCATIKIIDDDHSFNKNLEKIPQIIENILNEKH